MRDHKFMMIFGIILLGLIVVLTWPRILITVLAKATPEVVWQGPPSRAVISITFDDGPDPVYTPLILRILSDKHIKATFFLVGQRARQYPDLARAIRAEGHEVGNHSDSWRSTVGLGAAAFEQDLLRAEATLEINKNGLRFFRPAGILFRPVHVHVARRHGYTTVLGSGYAFDPYRPPSAFITWEITRALYPGAIVVLHDSGGSRTNTVKALPDIIEAARRRGLQFVTLAELLKT